MEPILILDEKKVKKDTEELRERMLASLRAQLEEVRRKKEKAVGPDAYNFYWQKEKELEKEIQKIETFPSIMT
ncbi:MAG: hypothetical protein FGF52_05240 [Candidatus Brockarchaeota archaeon]|nr:hypothetical protein [Candidatus Brockarchaeota archaeon]